MIHNVWCLVYFKLLLKFVLLICFIITKTYEQTWKNCKFTIFLMDKWFTIILTLNNAQVFIKPNDSYWVE